MRENLDLTRGLLFSQRILLALIGKGLKREDAYKIVQRNAMESWRSKTPLRDLLQADEAAAALLGPAELDSLFDYSYYLRNVGATFERLGLVAK
jgi:adenylosuccinate lyase